MREPGSRALRRAAGGASILCALALCAFGCSSDPTPLVVLVDTDYAVPEEVGLFRVSVERSDGTELGAHELTPRSQSDVPFSVGVAAGDDDSAAVTIVAEARAPSGGR